MGAAYAAAAEWFAAHGTAAAVAKAAVAAAASSAVTKAMSDDDSTAETTTATVSPTSGQADTNTASAKREAARKNALKHGLLSTIKAGGLGLGSASITRATLKKSLLGE
jgi:hypothetical protein